MPYNPNIHKRHSIRLKDYNYEKEGMYFITICIYNRECLLGKIKDDVGAESISAQVVLTKLGEMIERIYINLENEFKNIKLHKYIFMPNHIHGIIEICKRAEMDSAPTLANIIQSFKRHTTLECIKGVKQGIYKPFDKKIWQRNYYEHIIRNEKEFYSICEYITNNPLNWKEDSNFI